MCFSCQHQKTTALRRPGPLWRPGALRAGRVGERERGSRGQGLDSFLGGWERSSRGRGLDSFPSDHSEERKGESGRSHKGAKRESGEVEQSLGLPFAAAQARRQAWQRRRLGIIHNTHHSSHGMHAYNAYIQCIHTYTHIHTHLIWSRLIS